MAKEMLKLKDFYLGEGQSKYDGWDATQNLDVHSTIGTAQCQLGMAEDSTTPNEACVQATAADGTVYFFSTTSGKTWKRTTGGTVTLVNTNVNGAHVNAFYSPTLNKIIYCTTSKVGHLVAATDTFTDSFGTFTNGSSYHPIEDINQTVFIGDGKYAASISSALAFTANALDIPAQYSMTAFINYQHYLAIGTIIGTNVNSCMLYIWDTYSPSWSFDDEVLEPGICTFIKSDNLTYLLAGLEGNIYYLNGNNATFFFKIRGVTTAVGMQIATVLKRKPLLAIGTKIYSIYRAKRGVNDAVVHEYTTSGTITSIGVTGSQLLAHIGTKSEKIGTNYATAKITTPVIIGGTTCIYVNHESLPASTSISLESNVNGAGWVSETGFVNNATDMRYELQGGLTYSGTVKFFQLRVTLTPATTNTPIIQSIEIL
jgi:hypothetical protein